MPPKGEEVHPVWLMIDALVRGVPVNALESVLTAPPNDGACQPVGHVPLTVRRRWWQLPAAIEIAQKGRDSFSSLELFVFNPYQWLLKYPAGPPALTDSRR